MSDVWDTIPGIRGPNNGAAIVTATRHETFVIYRPLHLCRHCTRRLDKALETEGYEAPQGEEICPHTRKGEYDTILQRQVLGEIVDVRVNQTTLATGLVQVSVMWSEVQRAKGEAERQRPNRL